VKIKHWLSDLAYRIKSRLGMNVDKHDLLCTVYVCKRCKLTTTQVYGALPPKRCGRCEAPFSPFSRQL